MRAKRTEIFNFICKFSKKKGGVILCRLTGVNRGAGFAQIRGSFGSGDRYMTLIGLYFPFTCARPRATLKGVTGRIWPAGRHLRRPALHTVCRGKRKWKLVRFSSKWSQNVPLL